MGSIALHHIIYGVRACIRACRNGGTPVRAVQRVSHRTVHGRTTVHQCLCVSIILQIADSGRCITQRGRCGKLCLVVGVDNHAICRVIAGEIRCIAIRRKVGGELSRSSHCDSDLLGIGQRADDGDLTFIKADIMLRKRIGIAIVILDHRIAGNTQIGLCMLHEQSTGTVSCRMVVDNRTAGDLYRNRTVIRVDSKTSGMIGAVVIRNRTAGHPHGRRLIVVDIRETVIDIHTAGIIALIAGDGTAIECKETVLADKHTACVTNRLVADNRTAIHGQCAVIDEDSTTVSTLLGNTAVFVVISLTSGEITAVNYHCSVRLIQRGYAIRIGYELMGQVTGVGIHKGQVTAVLDFENLIVAFLNDTMTVEVTSTRIHNRDTIGDGHVSQQLKRLVISPCVYSILHEHIPGAVYCCTRFIRRNLRVLATYLERIRITRTAQGSIRIGSYHKTGIRTAEVNTQSSIGRSVQFASASETCTVHVQSADIVRSCRRTCHLHRGTIDRLGRIYLGTLRTGQSQGIVAVVQRNSCQVARARESLTISCIKRSRSRSKQTVRNSGRSATV